MKSTANCKEPEDSTSTTRVQKFSRRELRKVAFSALRWTESHVEDTYSGVGNRVVGSGEPYSNIAVAPRCRDYRGLSDWARRIAKGSRTFYHPVRHRGL